MKLRVAILGVALLLAACGTLPAPSGNGNDVPVPHRFGASCAQGSTIQVGVPATNAPLVSLPIRNNFQSAANDIDNLYQLSAGASAPPCPYTYQLWENTGNSPPALEQYDSAQWVKIGTINPATHIYTLDPGVVVNTSQFTGNPLAAALIPAPTASTLGGTEAYSAPTHQWLTGISNAGIPSSSQPSTSDISGLGSAASLAAAGTGTSIPTTEGSPSAGQVAEYNSDGSLSGASSGAVGTVTSVATGAGLTGGPVTGTGAISCVAPTSSVPGCPQVDGTTIVVSGRTISIPSSVALPGNPTATTQTAGTNNTTIATTAFVQTAVGGQGAPQGRLTLQSGSPIGETVTALAVTLNAAGITASYAPADTITLAGGTVTTPTVLTVTNTVLKSVAPLATGSGYVPADTVTLGFTGATFTGSVVATVTDTQVTSFAYHSAGSGTCTSGTYPFVINGSGPSVATGSAVINSSGAITSISVLTGGSYTSNPSLTAATPNYTGSPCTTTEPTINITMGPMVLTLTTNTAVFTVEGSAATQASTSGSGTGATFGSVLYAPNALTISTPGSYSTAPNNPVAQGSTSGSGAGATFTMSWGAGTVYYQSFGGGNNVPVYNGSSFVAEPIGTGLSLALDSNSGDTGYQASGNIYDIFAAVNGGTLVEGTGPAWTSSTARGTGSGTTQIGLQNGIWVNVNTITLRYGNSSGNTISVPAGEATYLGSFYATAAGATKSDLGCNFAVGGYGSVAGLYNAYHQMRTPYCSGDSTASWSYTTATWRAADNSNGNRITFLDGLGEAPIGGNYSALVEADSTGIAIDSSSATPMLFGTGPASLKSQVADDYIGPPELGLHYLQAMELGTTSGLITGGGQMWLRANLDN